MRNTQRTAANLERIKNFRLFDDIFMSQCLGDDLACTELVLQIILGNPDLKVTAVHTQDSLTNLLYRSIRLDVFATDSNGKEYDIEIQRTASGASYRRARYNSSMLDTRLLKKGRDFKDLPETYIIFITEDDVMKLGKPLYHVERFVLETQELFDDGAHILYVNGSFRDDLPIGKLMHDFFCTNPDDMYFSLLANRVRFYKEYEEGISIMCESMEQVFEQALKEGRIGLAVEMYVAGDISAEKAAEKTDLPVEEILRRASEKAE